MKQMVCEMCGGTDLVKDGGVFVCQSCGVKYTVEEARKMLVEVEGAVEVTGTVQVDNTPYVEKYLQNARRAKEKQDWEETEKYYNMVEQNDPDNIEAIFYSAYGKAMASLIDGDIYKRQAAFKVLENCVSIIDDHYRVKRREENKAAILNMARDLTKMVTSDFVYTEWKNRYGIVTRTNKDETYSLFVTLIAEFRKSVRNIAKKDNQPYLHKILIEIFMVVERMDIDRQVNKLCMDWISIERKSLAASQEKEKSKMVKEYWANHPDEKAAIEEECASLRKDLEKLSAREDALPGMKEKRQCEKQIASLEKEISSLGMFAGKTKREKQEQIDVLRSRVKEIEASSTGALVANLEGRRKTATSKLSSLENRLKTAGL